MDLAALMTKPDVWKIILAMALPAASALSTWLFKSPVLKVLVLFYGALGAVFCILWYLDWIIFGSIGDLLLATLLVFTLHAPIMGHLRLIPMMLIDALSFAFVVWLIPSMSAKSLMLSTLLYIVFANAFCYVVSLFFPKAPESDDEYIDY